MPSAFVGVLDFAGSCHRGTRVAPTPEHLTTHLRACVGATQGTKTRATDAAVVVRVMTQPFELGGSALPANQNDSCTRCVGHLYFSQSTTLEVSSPSAQWVALPRRQIAPRLDGKVCLRVCLIRVSSSIFTSSHLGSERGHCTPRAVVRPNVGTVNVLARRAWPLYRTTVLRQDNRKTF
jgi:hypothetical protein